ncbi:MAG TPA: phosphoenolpyruvate carboxylase, partial [Terricaulis sp.]|nr:phosphoenolpyruvate carboxylase [Terricaulis sp.]
PAALRTQCLALLAAQSDAAQRDPMAAGVRALAIDLLEQREAGALGAADLHALVKHVADEALRARAQRMAESKPGGDWAGVVAEALAPLKGKPLEEIKAALERPRAGVVFTAHPTFALSRAMREALAALAGGGEADLAPLPHLPDQPVTLAYEHEDAAAAITRAQDALSGFNAAVFDWLEANADGAWWAIAPAPVRLATWVGYDLDGRTDIHWAQTIRFRLIEKAAQLARYAQALAPLGKAAKALGEKLARAGKEAEAQAALFDGDLNDPARTVAAANRLTGEGPDRLVSIGPMIAQLDDIIAGASGDARKALCLVRTQMAAFGLGAAAIHLRVNASQVRSAVQADLGLAADGEFMDRRAMDAAAERSAHAVREAVNFGAIFQEKMTARRQLMLAAQIVKHIDADAPIRFLIAELEAPATIMGAIYLARLYGVADRLDVSPLFETPDVLERGGRVMERLLDEPEYRAYIQKRGRLCVQYGFSDSGRFMGQIAADIAVERLHVLLSRAMAARGVKGVEALVFNTHGESMGRGAYPGAMQERLDYLLTPWARARFDHDGVAVNAEVSFQGGDGYLHFQTPALAEATLRAVVAWAFRSPHGKADDAFYADINFSWDIYRAVKNWQEELFADKHYQRVLGAFGANLLPSTGSRKTRRQSGTSKDDAARSLRAIPHNAILQQLASPANVSGGFGQVAAREPERFVAHVSASPRFTALVRMANAARRLTSISVLRTYADFYSPSFWTIRAARTDDDAVADRALRIAGRLEARELDVAIERLANLLSADRRQFDSVSRGLLPFATGDSGFERDLYILHAARLIWIVEGFTLAASIPAFSGRHDMTRDDLIDLALDLRFADLADALMEIFPVTSEAPAAFDALTEAGPADAHAGYPHIAREIAAPLRALDAAIKEVTVSVTHFYGAFG